MRNDELIVTNYIRVLLSVIVSLALFARAEAPLYPKVVTSPSVDCSSVQSIVHDVVKPGMSDQEELFALYYWFRRTIHHYRMMGGDRRDVLRLINSYGSGLCGSQAVVFRQLCNAASLQARIISGDGAERARSYLSRGLVWRTPARSGYDDFVLRALA
ncbi:MAG: transglutaminase domain-containing protein [Bryobacteraceae bacterium]